MNSTDIFLLFFFGIFHIEREDYCNNCTSRHIVDLWSFFHCTHYYFDLLAWAISLYLFCFSAIIIYLEHVKFQAHQNNWMHDWNDLLLLCELGIGRWDFVKCDSIINDSTIWIFLFPTIQIWTFTEFYYCKMQSFILDFGNSYHFMWIHSIRIVMGKYSDLWRKKNTQKWINKNHINESEGKSSVGVCVIPWTVMHRHTWII